MLQSFIIVLREGFESFLIVAIILSYLNNTQQRHLVSAVYSAIAVAITASIALGYYLMQGVNQALWEAIFGLIAVVMVGTLVVHMWRAAPHLRRKMHQRLENVSANRATWRAFAGVFLFTFLMITREGMETALMLMQVRVGRYLTGALLGLVAAIALSWAWVHFSHLINLKRFFQVTSVFLLLFMIQVAIYSFHEFTEAGVLPNSDALHEATEAFSPDGIYGKWFSILAISGCALWLAFAWIADRVRNARSTRTNFDTA